MGMTDTEGPFFAGGGCEDCRGAGYRGRVGIFELLVIDEPLRELILERKSSAELNATAKIYTMQQDAIDKARAGITSIEEILRVCSGD